MSLRTISTLYVTVIISVWILAFVFIANNGFQSSELSSRNEPTAIVVGLPKSGTTSVYHYFLCNGFDTTHYCCCGSAETQYPCSDGTFMSHKILENLKSAKSLFLGIKGEVHAQLDGELFENTEEPYFLPQHFYLEELHKAAPHAVWVLPLRSTDSWKRSVEEWLDMGDRLQSAYRHYVKLGKGASSVLEGDFLVNFYDWHTKTVREACRKYRRACVEVTVDDNAGSKLEQAFPGTKASCWGRHNVGPFIQIAESPWISGMSEK